MSTALLVLATSTLSAQVPVENRNARQGFWIGLGLGAIQYYVSNFWRPSAPVAVADMFFPFYGKADAHALAAYGSFGLGYEFRVGHNTSINAFLNGLASTAAKLEFAEVSQPSSQHIKLNLVQAGVGVTWH